MRQEVASGAPDVDGLVVRLSCNLLIDACLREPFTGIGKPEQLKYGAQGSWSRRISDEHRLVYPGDVDDLVILQARYHY